MSLADAVSFKVVSRSFWASDDRLGRTLTVSSDPVLGVFASSMSRGVLWRSGCQAGSDKRGGRAMRANVEYLTEREVAACAVFCSVKENVL